VRLHRVLEGIALVDFDRDPAGLDVAEQLARQFGAFGRVTTSDPLTASCIASIGGTGPDAVPKQTSRPRRASESSEDAKVACPMLSNTTGTPAPPVSSRTRSATFSRV